MSFRPKSAQPQVRKDFWEQ